jgi:electron transfer flavoprotein alpha subunit
MAGEILVFSDDPGLLGQLVAGARHLASAVGWSVVAYRPDPPMKGGGTAADDVDNAWACVQGLSEAAAEEKARLLLVGATRLGMEVAPRVAERWGAGYAAWALAVEIDPSTGGTTASCMLYAGAGVAEYRFQHDHAVLTIGDGVFEAEHDPVDVTPRQLGSPAASSITVLRHEAKPAHAEDLEHSSLVVDCGKGLATLDDLEQARSLADLLGGHVACSRPLASDRDWFSDWLGLSGMRIKPEFCLTLGISGSVQHLIGIRDARLIAAVNRDEDAPIFSQADLGVVADLREFLPVLIQRVKERGIRPAWRAAGQAAPSVDPALGKEV